MDGARPPPGSRPGRAAGGHYARGLRTLLAAWSQPFHWGCRQQEAGPVSLPPGPGALWSVPQWLQTSMSEFLGPGTGYLRGRREVRVLRREAILDHGACHPKGP